MAKARKQLIVSTENDCTETKSRLVFEAPNNDVWLRMECHKDGVFFDSSGMYDEKLTPFQAIKLARKILDYYKDKK